MTFRRDPDDVVAARARHPTAAWRPSDQVASWISAILATRGGRWPAIGARLVAQRARTGLDPEAFAAAAGVSTAVLRRCEAGIVGPDDLPAPLRRLAG